MRKFVVLLIVTYSFLFILTACGGASSGATGNTSIPPSGGTSSPNASSTPPSYWSCNATIIQRIHSARTAIKPALLGWCGLGAPPPTGDSPCVVTPPGTSSSINGWCGPVAPGGTAGGVDWLTWGFDAQRSGFNPKETQISTTSAPSLKLKWSTNLGGVIYTQPLVATQVAVASSNKDIVYVGNSGQLSALNIADGSVVWQKQLQTSTVCNSTWGITSTPVIDRSTNHIYIVDGMGQLYGFDLGTGAVAAGWPSGGVKVVTNSGADYVWSALQFVPASGQLYIGTASYEDCVTPWSGSVVSVNAASGAVSATWNAFQAPQWGSGVWGWGGVTVDPDSGNIYAATGNTEQNENADSSDSVVELSPGLSLIAQNAPLDRSTNADFDFGAGVLVYDDGGSCLGTENKNGTFFVYDRTNLTNGPTQSLVIGPTDPSPSSGNLEAPAYSPVTHMLYEGNAVYKASSSVGYPRGLLAFTVQAGCKFTLAWQQPFNISSDNIVDNPVASPTIANGVVFVSSGMSGEIFAYNATSGAPLWNSSGITKGPIFNSPSISGGMIFVGSAAGTLYAFGI